MLFIACYELRHNNWTTQQSYKVLSESRAKAQEAEVIKTYTYEYIYLEISSFQSLLML